MKIKALVASLSAMAFVAAAPVQANENDLIDDIVGSLSVASAIPDVTVQDSELFAIVGGFQHVALEEEIFGETIEGSGTAFAIAAGMHLTNSVQVSAGLATDVEDMGEDLAFKFMLRWAPKRATTGTASWPIK